MEFVRIDERLEEFDSIMQSEVARKILYLSMYEYHHANDVNNTCDSVSTETIMDWVDGRQNAIEFMECDSLGFLWYAAEQLGPELHAGTDDKWIRNLVPFACHFIANVYLYVATQMFPKEGFYIIGSQANSHTTLINAHCTKVFDPYFLYKAMKSGYDLTKAANSTIKNVEIHQQLYATNAPDRYFSTLKGVNVPCNDYKGKVKFDKGARQYRFKKSDKNINSKNTVVTLLHTVHTLEYDVFTRPNSPDYREAA